MMSSKHKSGASGSADGQIEALKCFLHKKRLKGESRMLYVEVAKVRGKKGSAVHEIMKKEKETGASFAVTPQTAKLWPLCVVSTLLRRKRC